MNRVGQPEELVGLLLLLASGELQLHNWANDHGGWGLEHMVGGHWVGVTCQRLELLCGLFMRPAGDLQERCGSHRIYKHPDKPGTVVIAGNEGYDLHKGTYNNILKQAGLK